MVGSIDGETIQLKVGKRGPITEIILKVFSIVGNLFNILIFNTDVCKMNRKIAKKKCKDKNRKLGPFNSCGKKRKGECSMFLERENHGILYGIFFSIFDPIFNLFGEELICRGSQQKYYNKRISKCDKKKGAIG